VFLFPPSFLSFRLVELLFGFVHRLMTTPALGCAKRHIAGGMAVESSPGYKKRYRMAEGNMEEVGPYNDLSRMADREWIRGRELLAWVRYTSQLGTRFQLTGCP